MSWDRGINTLISDTALPAESRWVIWNIYETLEHTIAKLPFRSPVEGMWRFDGQFYIPPPKPQADGGGDG